MKSSYIKIFSVSAMLLLLITSCRKDLTNVENESNYVGDSFSDVFEAYWNGMNNNYVFWSIDTTDWDRVYTTYKPLFASLDINSDADQLTAYKYFKAMADGLTDSHYTLSFASDALADSAIWPSYDRKLAAGTIRTHYVFYGYDATYYLDKDYVYGVDSVNTLEGSSTEAIAGTISFSDGGKALYLAFNQFNLAASYEASDDNGVKKVMTYFINYLQNNASTLKGVIIDVRGNTGGAVADLNFLVGQLTGTKLVIGATRYKNGNGRLDYTPWADAIVTPQSTGQTLTVPVVALADMWSISMAEITTMAIHALPTGAVVGETTWGANGPLTANENYNGGQFYFSWFGYAYTSSSQFRYKDGNIYEGEGFPPDYSVPFSLDDFNYYGDRQLETALGLM
ncbi:S41 family peptidase [Parafilimonas sp.]|uniref:S41 family peptidase n=1 Tax=Parafilimonas sp. TaxID=1969739 RepID=UPI0039E2D0A2